MSKADVKIINQKTDRVKILEIMCVKRKSVKILFEINVKKNGLLSEKNKSE